MEHLKNRMQTAVANLAEQISFAKSDYESKLIQDFATTNQAKIFRYIRDLTKSDYTPQRLFYDDCAAACDIEKATMFNNNYFYSVFTSSSTTSLVDNTMDTNGIGPKVLKGCAVSLYKPFHYLYNLILRQHCLPLERCIHCIVPIFRSGDKFSVYNYRPVSLLCNSSKVLEQLIYDKIIGHVYKQLSCLQFGFLKNRSVIQELLIVFNGIMNKPQQTDVIYLDFRKAFDSVSHNKLLSKLKHVGIAGGDVIAFKHLEYNVFC